MRVVIFLSTSHDKKSPTARCRAALNTQKYIDIHSKIGYNKAHETATP
jgi:hypothetical protein